MKLLETEGHRWMPMLRQTKQQQEIADAA